MKDLIVSLIHEEEGATAIEYGLIAALIAVVTVTAVAALGYNLSQLFYLISTIFLSDQGDGPPVTHN